MSGPHSLRARLFIATATTPSAISSAPMPSQTMPAKSLPSSGLTLGGAPVDGATLVEQQALDGERAEHGSGELSEDVDDGVDRVDPPAGRRRRS